MDSKKFFLSSHTQIKFGIAQGFGQGVIAHEVPPNFGTRLDCGTFEEHSLARLSEHLKKVKWEISEKYKR